MLQTPPDERGIPIQDTIFRGSAHVPGRPIQKGGLDSLLNGCFDYELASSEDAEYGHIRTTAAKSAESADIWADVEKVNISERRITLRELKLKLKKNK